MSSHDVQEPPFVHEKLKDQVTLSIKEALDKATAVLSNLHRVRSYLDVIKAMTPPRPASHGEGICTTLDQVKSIRNDVAALLQTIYLAEIGLQSMQEFDKQGSLLLTASLPMLGMSTTNNESTAEHQSITSAEGGVVVVDVDMPGDIDFGVPAIAKKDICRDQGVAIIACTHCGHRFASQRSEETQQLCKSCRITAVQGSAFQASTSTSGGVVSATTPNNGLLAYSSTPIFRKSGRSGKRGSIPPMMCKICNVSFHYRRCLLRHLKENHNGIDVSNLQKYIDTPTSQTVKKAKTGEDSTLFGNIGSDINSSTADSSSQSDSGLMINDPTIGRIVASSSLGEDITSGSLLDNNELSPEEDLGGSKLPLLTDIQVKPGSQFVCTNCSKVFDRPYRLQRHMQIHNPNRPRVSCDLCDRTFTRLDTLENHMKCLHTEDRPFKCDSCNKTFATQSTLFHHQKAHTDGKPYHCQECNTSFALLNEYKQHVKISHASTLNLRCSDCYKVFPSEAELERHKLAEHRLECEICGKTFARLAYLKMHVQIHEGDNLFNCQFCSTGFDTEYAYKQHLRIHPEYQTAKRTYHCQVCDKVFQHPSNLVAHYHSQKHQEKTNSLDINTSSILSTIEHGDLSHDISALVDEVTMSSDEDGLIQSIANNEPFQDSVSCTDDYAPTNPPTSE